MKTSIIRIIIILFFVVALPLTYFVVKQASNLSENEEIVQRVFDKQLETILYTVNQNSENLINWWVNQLDILVDYDGETMQKITTNIFVNNPEVEQIHFFEISSHEELASYARSGVEKGDMQWPGSQMVDRLSGFIQKGNYQKIQAEKEGDFVQLYFILKSSNNSVLALITVRSKTFVDRGLKPGIQQISQDRFNINIIDSTDNTYNLLSDTTLVEQQNIHQKDMLYLPGYKITISLKSATINELVTARVKRDNYIFIAMLILILAGITFVILTIRKEIKLAELKSEFVSNVSHEIRTPLALISMYTETLLMNRIKSDEKKNEYLNIIHLESNRLTDMVNHILSFSKMEKGKRTYHMTNVEINVLINQVVTHFQPHFESENVKCKVELCADNCVIAADKEAVSEALINLIENAIKYSKEKNKEITIRTRIIDSKVIVEVQDNGIGIAPKHLKYIFDKFYRVTQGNLAHKAKGSGIGLNIVKQIMDHHDAQVTVKSKEGEGSTFGLNFHQIKMSHD